MPDIEGLPYERANGTEGHGRAGKPSHDAEGAERVCWRWDQAPDGELVIVIVIVIVVWTELDVVSR